MRKGSTLTPAHRAKISAALKGRPQSPESNEKRRQALLGSKHSAVRKDRIARGVRKYRAQQRRSLVEQPLADEDPRKTWLP
jgi:hypothetical protein